MIKNAWVLYTDTVDAIAEEVFERTVRPFCERRKLRFIAGNGDWWVSPLGSRTHWYPEDFLEDEEWQAVVKLLSIYIPGMPGNDLGSLMPIFVNSEPRCDFCGWADGEHAPGCLRAEGG